MRDNSSTKSLPVEASGRFAMRSLLLPAMLASGLVGQVLGYVPLAQAQFDGASAQSANIPLGNSGIQPYIPEVVGGLPPNSSGLEQPVYINTKSESAEAVSSQAFSSFLENEREMQEFGKLVVEATEDAPQINYQEFESAIRVAVVGNEPILLGDVFPQSMLKKFPPRGTDEKFWTMLDEKLRQELKGIIVRKALYQRFFDQQVAGKSNKERDAARQQINKKTTEMFYKDVLPEMATSFGFESVEDFYAGLAKEGRTVQSIQRGWAESVISKECLRGGVETDPRIELLDMKNYYEDHQEEFQQRAKVRFEVLTAEFSKYPSKQAAYDAVAEMGNQVYFGDALAAVAKKSSSGFAAANSGQVDWTSKGALKSKVIDTAAFSLPLNQLSDILEDTDAYHIVRVLERKEEMITPFVEVQGDIKKKLTKLKSEANEKAFEEKVLRETAIWTRWPEDFPGAMPISLLER